VDFDIDTFGSEGVSVGDVDVHIRMGPGVPDVQLCTCRILEFAAENSGARVFEFAQRFVRWMQTEVLEEPRVIECWRCGLKRQAPSPVREVCAAACGHDGPGDRAAPPALLLLEPQRAALT
jgi:hypothetical protein